MTSEEVAAFLSSLRLKYPSSDPRRKWTNFLFHFTDITNVASIFQRGELLPRSTLLDSSVHFTNTASTEILSATKEEYKHFVRLYFRPRVPMLHSVEGMRPFGEILRSAHCAIPVYFLFDSARILARPDCLVSSGNLSTTTQELMIESPIPGLYKIPFEMVFHDTWYRPEEAALIRFHRQAEVLVPNKLKIQDLKWIFVRSEAELATLRNLLLNEPGPLWGRYASRVKINTGDALFTRRWIYFDRVVRIGGSIFAEMNPDATKRGPFEITVMVNLRGEDGPTKRLHHEHQFYFPRGPVEWRVPAAWATKPVRIRVSLDRNLAFDGVLREGEAQFE